MLPLREMGGRVFIDDESAYFVEDLSTRTFLCGLSWPKDRDVISEIDGYHTALETSEQWNDVEMGVSWRP